MRHLNYALVLLMLLSLVGCAGIQLSREEMLVFRDASDQSRIKTYQGFDQEQLIQACEAALLSFDNDYGIVHSHDGFLAGRNWMVYFVIGMAMGSDYWKIVVTVESENTVKVELKSWPGPAYGGMLPLPISPGGSEINYIWDPSLYALFFARVDYILGLTDNCLTCEDARSIIHSSESYDPKFNQLPVELRRLGSETSLCTHGNDKRPQQLFTQTTQ